MGLGRAGLLFGRVHGGGEPVHFCFEQVEGHRIGVVRLHQAGAFVVQRGQPPRGLLGLAVGLGGGAVELGSHAVA